MYREETLREKALMCKKIRLEVGSRRLLVHMSMCYRCHDCGATERIYLGVGVQGPVGVQHWIACPFIMQCRLCDGESKHIEWSNDRHFEPTDQPLGSRAFVVPENGPDPKHYNSSCYAGEVYTRKVKR